jgi:hypothetical protein
MRDLESDDGEIEPENCESRAHRIDGDPGGRPFHAHVPHLSGNLEFNGPGRLVARDYT